MIIHNFITKTVLLTFFRSQPKFFTCKKGLDGRITDCKFVIHARCVDERRKMDNSVKCVRNKKNKSVENRSMMSPLEEEKYVVTTA